MPRKVLGVGGSGGVTYSSGGTTNNVIPKSNGAGSLQDSSITDNGTTVTTTEPIIGPSGSASNVAFATGQANTGMYSRVAGQLNLANAGLAKVVMASYANGNFAVEGGYGYTTSAASGVTPDLWTRRRAAANLQIGEFDINGTPVDQTISVQNAITGSNLPGGHFTIDAPLGTGTGATSKVSVNRALMAASGTTAQTSANAWAVGMSKTLSNTSATAQTIATITLGSNAGGGAAGTFTLVATDGTNFDSETQSFNVSFVNKAGAVTVGSVVVTSSTAANNSGSATLGITAVANGNNIDIKVTPVFTTIVPTTVTLYPVITHSTNTVTFS